MSGAPAAVLQVGQTSQEDDQSAFEMCYSLAESSILLSRAPSAVVCCSRVLPTSAVRETNAALPSNVQTAFPPLDGGDWPETPLANLKKVSFYCPVVSLYAHGAWTVLLQGGLLLSCVPVLEVLMARAWYVRRALMHGSLIQ